MFSAVFSSIMVENAAVWAQPCPKNSASSHLLIRRPAVATLFIKFFSELSALWTVKYSRKSVVSNYLREISLPHLVTGLSGTKRSFFVVYSKFKVLRRWRHGALDSFSKSFTGKILGLQSLSFLSFATQSSGSDRCPCLKTLA